MTLRHAPRCIASSIAPSPTADSAVQLRRATAASAGAPPRPLQYKGGGDTSRSAHAAAAAGTKGSGGRLPHGDAIQKSFGRHNVNDVQAHIGGDAAKVNEALGAEAYATGNHVAFKGAPSLHTAAHEAAHVVQQRAGVSLKGGVGEAGDEYERHADQVADAVVQGRSAEPLLDRGGGGSSVGAKEAIQRSEDETKPPVGDGDAPQAVEGDVSPPGTDRRDEAASSADGDEGAKTEADDSGGAGSGGAAPPEQDRLFELVGLQRQLQKEGRRMTDKELDLVLKWSKDGLTAPAQMVAHSLVEAHVMSGEAAGSPGGAARANGTEPPVDPATCDGARGESEMGLLAKQDFDDALRHITRASDLARSLADSLSALGGSVAAMQRKGEASSSAAAMLEQIHGEQSKSEWERANPVDKVLLVAKGVIGAAEGLVNYADAVKTAFATIETASTVKAQYDAIKGVADHGVTANKTAGAVLDDVAAVIVPELRAPPPDPYKDQTVQAIKSLQEHIASVQEATIINALNDAKDKFESIDTLVGDSVADMGKGAEKVAGRKIASDHANAMAQSATAIHQTGGATKQHLTMLKGFVSQPAAPGHATLDGDGETFGFLDFLNHNPAEGGNVKAVRLSPQLVTITFDGYQRERGEPYDVFHAGYSKREERANPILVLVAGTALDGFAHSRLAVEASKTPGESTYRIDPATARAIASHEGLRHVTVSHPVPNQYVLERKGGARVVIDRPGEEDERANPRTTGDWDLKSNLPKYQQFAAKNVPTKQLVRWEDGNKCNNQSAESWEIGATGVNTCADRVYVDGSIISGPSQLPSGFDRSVWPKEILAWAQMADLRAAENAPRDAAQKQPHSPPSNLTPNDETLQRAQAELKRDALGNAVAGIDGLMSGATHRLELGVPSEEIGLASAEGMDPFQLHDALQKVDGWYVVPLEMDTAEFFRSLVPRSSGGRAPLRQ